MKKNIVICMLVLILMLGMVGCSQSETAPTNNGYSSHEITISKSNIKQYVDDIEIIDAYNNGNNVTFKIKMTLNEDISSIRNLKVTYSTFLHIDYRASNGSNLHREWGYIMLSFVFTNSLSTTITKTVYNNANHTISTISDAYMGGGYFSNASGYISL